jgi:threonyl-tRNA synthetase
MPSLSVLRQSAAEVLALTALELFPGALLIQCAATENGFYCDLLASQPIDDYAVPLLEESMRKTIKASIEVRSLDMMREVAVGYLEHKGHPLRAEAVEVAPENIVSLIQIGEFCDYCPSPYVTNTSEVAAFKVLRVERLFRDLDNGQSEEFKRIHGIVASDKQALKKMVKAYQAGKKTDHSFQSHEKKLFSFHSDISKLEWVWEGQGMNLKNKLSEWWKKEHQTQQFQLVSTPVLIRESLARKAGLKEVLPTLDMEGVEYVIPPSSTPSHMALFAEKKRFEKEMPIRYAECSASVYRKPMSDLWGILNSHLQSADSSHIFCAPCHLEKELISSLQFIDKTIKIFGFEYHWHFAGRGQRFAGSEHRWEKAVATLNAAFEKCGWTYTADPDEYSYQGPIVEARLTDRFGREWRGPWIRIDFYSPEKFGLAYQGADQKTHGPIMIVRSLFGSLERFVALLLEHSQGEFLL